MHLSKDLERPREVVYGDGAYDGVEGAICVHPQRWVPVEIMDVVVMQRRVPPKLLVVHANRRDVGKVAVGLVATGAVGQVRRPRT